VRLAPLAFACLLAAACASGPPPPDWRLQARAALAAYERAWLAGERRAEAELARAREAVRGSGRGDLLARIELLACALRVATLDFDGCPGFEPYRAEASAEELAYAEYLAGKRRRTPSAEPLARLVAAALAVRAGKETPSTLAEAIEIASSQGWRRPLLAWLELAAQRAEAAGEESAAAAYRRRIGIVVGDEDTVRSSSGAGR